MQQTLSGIFFKGRGKIMHRKIIAALAFVAVALSCLFCMPGCESPTTPPYPHLADGSSSPVLSGIINPDSEVRGVWIASTWNIDYPSRTDLPADELKTELDRILDACSDLGLNTVFFQVRPACDALYESDMFPVSKALSTTGELLFDPLGYLVYQGHLRNIFVHAWVNPLRITLQKTAFEDLPDGPAKSHPEWCVDYADKLYFDCGLPEVRQLVADGVREIVEKYDVDGVVFDDYFYPYPAYDGYGRMYEFHDENAYEKYGEGHSLEDWRRENVNMMVRLCYDTVHETDPECVFGISPFGVWQNDDGENGGSRTKNFEAYKSLFCDATAWIDGGYIDYICPQIYWATDSKTSPYEVVLDWWNTRLDGSNIRLYVAHASYMYEEGEWDSPEGELTEQIEMSRLRKYYRGSISYGFEELRDNVRSAGNEIKLVYSSPVIYSDIVSNGCEPELLSHSDGQTVDTGTILLGGMSDPYYALTLNGARVGRMKDGSFRMELKLEEGENVLTFIQNGKEYVWVITYAPGEK